MEIIPTSKGGNKLCYDNFMYLRNRTFNKKIRWTCIKRRKDYCRAILCTGLNFENPVVEGNHNHDGSSSEIEDAKLRASLKERALQSEEHPKHLLASVFANLDEKARTKLGNVTSLRRTIMRHQQRGRSRESSFDKANKDELVSPKLEISSPVRREQDLELPKEPAKIANCGTSSHTARGSQENSLCPMKQEPNRKASLCVQEQEDANLAAAQGRKRQRSRRNPGTVQVRKRQRKRTSPEAVQEKPKETPSHMQPVTGPGQQEFMQPVAVREEHKRVHPEAVREQEHKHSSTEIVQEQKQKLFISDPVLQEPEPGSHMNPFQEFASSAAVMKQVQEDGIPGMIRELRSPETREKEGGDTKAVQELPCVSPIQELEGSEDLGAVQELPAVQGPQGTNSEVTLAFPCVPTTQEPESTSSVTFQGLAYIAPEPANPEQVQEFPTAQKMNPDSTQNCHRASLALQPAVFNHGVSMTFSLAEDLQRRLEVVTGERDSLLYAKNKWEKERLLLVNQRHHLVSEKAALQQHLDALTNRTRFLLLEQEDLRKWKANIENETDSIRSEQMKLHEEKMVLKREKEAFLQEKTNWELQIISFHRERDSFQFERLNYE